MKIRIKMGEINQLIKFVKIAATDVYKELHAGYNESVYEEAMAVEFRNRGIEYDVEKKRRYSIRA